MKTLLARRWRRLAILTPIALLVLTTACSFQTEFPSAPDCPGFEKEREIILRTIGEPRVSSGYEFRCAPAGFSAALSSQSGGHSYGISVTAYDTDEEAEAALGTPNSTFRESPAVHVREIRHPGVMESLTWWRSRWVFGAGRFDDTETGSSSVFTGSELMHDAAVEMGLFTAAPPRSDLPIEFVMNDSYALGEPIEFKIKNISDESYSYISIEQCVNVNLYGPDESPVGTDAHCDVLITTEIGSGEEVVLSTWNQYDCRNPDFLAGCGAACTVMPGTYRATKGFRGVDRETDFLAQWTFVIEPPIAPLHPDREIAFTPECHHYRTDLVVDLLDSGGRGPFEFAPANFTFKRGEEVKFTFTSETVFHTFTVDDLGIDVPVDGGDTVELEFTFDKAGTYDLICIPHQSLGMTGTITVK